ncbi:MAG: hypothetical protein AAF430_23650 [Myxococcota bacterium]
MRVVECEGAPRDCGGDQGRALRDAIVAACGGGGVATLWRAWRSGAEARRQARDVRRYFPHQAEWLEGMARAAGVPTHALIAGLADTPETAIAVVVTDDGVRVGATAVPDSTLRRVAPEGRFGALELAAVTASQPWLGVNASGLVVAFAARPGPKGRFAAPAAMLARDCLERFEAVGPALEWCLSRPAAPGGAMLLADAAGVAAGVDFSGAERRALPEDDGVLAFGLGDDVVAELRKQRHDLAAVERSLAAAGTPVLADPAGRLRPSAVADWTSLEA